MSNVEWWNRFAQSFINRQYPLFDVRCSSVSFLWSDWTFAARGRARMTQQLAAGVRHQSPSLENPASSIKHPKLSFQPLLPIEIQFLNCRNQMSGNHLFFPIKPCYYYLDNVSTGLIFQINYYNPYANGREKNSSNVRKKGNQDPDRFRSIRKEC